MATEKREESQMGNFIKQLFSSSAKAFDVFNLGRLFFYTAAGSLALIPVVMILRLITLESVPITFTDSLRKVVNLNIFVGDAGSEGNTALIAFLVTSVLVGFLIANVGFIVVISPLEKKLDRRLREELSDFSERENYSIGYNYPRLKNNLEGEDYDSWLSTEYFRFVEIIVYIPIGFIIGMIFSAIYVFIYLGISLFNENISPDQTLYSSTILSVLVISIVILQKGVWSIWWYPKIVKETMFAYLFTQAALIKRLEKIPFK